MEKVKSEHLSKFSFFGLIVTLGIVYGDIGTSPLYVMKAIIGANAHINADYIIGAVSCIIWTLTLQTTVMEGVIMPSAIKVLAPIIAMTYSHFFLLLRTNA